GSANDGQIWESASTKDLTLPLGRYFRADAGSPSCDALLVPYCATRCHHKEW
ncbi:hypothetical protein BV22DRAFT_974871, partial [Leucogyrophana mollusca]